MKSVHVFADSETMAEEIACRWSREAEIANKVKGVFSVVLSGGTTALKVYQKMASPLWVNKIPWKVVHIFWADERCVLPESQESNYQIISRTFLNHVPIPDENVHRIKGEEEPERESIRYAKEIEDHMILRNVRDTFFDWVLLGLGVDGHTASLFPGQEKIFKALNLCGVTQHPDTNQTRITLTPFTIQSSACVTYHVIGKKKAEIVSALVSKSNKNNKYPAANISGEWYLDQAAASKLKPF